MTPDQKVTEELLRWLIKHTPEVTGRMLDEAVTQHVTAIDRKFLNSYQRCAGLLWGPVTRATDVSASFRMRVAIDNVTEMAKQATLALAELKALNAALGNIAGLEQPSPSEPIDAGDQSDGYHTFNELYEHRHALFLNLMSLCPSISWVSLLHADGTMFSESFIGGMNFTIGVITYHLPIRLWNIACYINGITVLDRAPEWDGHTSPDVVARLYAFLKYSNPSPAPPPEDEVDEWLSRLPSHAALTPSDPEEES